MEIIATLSIVEQTAETVEEILEETVNETAALVEKGTAITEAMATEELAEFINQAETAATETEAVEAPAPTLPTEVGAFTERIATLEAVVGELALDCKFIKDHIKLAENVMAEIAPASYENALQNYLKTRV